MTPELAAAVTIELTTAGRKARKLFDSMVRERGLTLARARALLLLSTNRAWNQTDLAEALDIEHPSVVRLLDGLERQGLIARAAVEGDRRAKRIKLTPLAEEQVRELEELTQTVRRLLLRGIPEADLKVALKVLRQVTANAEPASPAEPEMQDAGAR